MAQPVIKWAKMMDIQANTFVYAKSSIKKSSWHWIKLYRWISLLIIIKPFYKRNSLQGWYIAGFINHLKKLANRKKLYQWIGLLFNIEIRYKRNLPKSWLFAGFCHHHLMTMSAYAHAYHYTFFESGTKTGLRTIALCRKVRVLLSKHK